MTRTKTLDEHFRYTGENGHQGYCRVRIYIGKDLPPVIIATEPNDNTGPSLTNSAEIVFPAIIARYLPGWLDQAEDLTLIEHYEPSHGWGSRKADTYDQVTFTDWRPRIRQLAGGKFVSFGEPEWRHLGEAKTRELVGAID